MKLEREKTNDTDDYGTSTILISLYVRHRFREIHSTTNKSEEGIPVGPKVSIERQTG